MDQDISQRELRNNSGKVMRELRAGKSFVVTSNGTPIGRLTPLNRRRFVPATEAVGFFRTAPDIDYERWRADLDAIADQDPTPLA
ncbi:MAG: type II toxin-antitoxin system prevent-host-death family antitoxin [Acidimicrobiia bacterium]|nr:type II toxin-antitoxin system prevent-host-death family antitoxin [Acidimicrobiia bacterium]MYB44501.1 type II toxin-antitoxin system prevent-host-death family antitoxin [Acidimicrobiia bacterium]